MGVQLRNAVVLTVLSGGLWMGAHAQQKPAVPDAQIESDVLKALASAPELSTQDIQTTTVYGVVTLRGSAKDESSRSKAESLASRVAGVRKVVDEMTLAGEERGDANYDAAHNLPSTSPRAEPSDTAPEPGYSSPPAPGAAEGHYEAGSGQVPEPPAGRGVQQMPVSPQTDARYPADANGNYPPPPPRSGQYPPRRPLYRGNPPYAPQSGYAQQGGQEAGRRVTIASGALVRIRINQGLSTNHSQAGSVFDGTVLNDVVADGAVAIPRGASVQGTVLDAKSAGVLKGRGELALQLTRLTLGGQTYPLTSDVWSRNGQDKTVRTVDSALGLGALGAVFGAVAGGGAGAAIGAGVGGAAGVASSAASQGGSVIVPPEAVLTFHLQQPMTVATVSEQEMGRLSYAAGPNSAGPALVQRRRYPAVYYNPYPYYGPYGPYYGPRY